MRFAITRSCYIRIKQRVWQEQHIRQVMIWQLWKQHTFDMLHFGEQLFTLLYRVACGCYRNQGCGKQETWISNFLNAEDPWVSFYSCNCRGKSRYSIGKHKIVWTKTQKQTWLYTFMSSNSNFPFPTTCEKEKNSKILK